MQRLEAMKQDTVDFDMMVSSIVYLLVLLPVMDILSFFTGND